LQQSERNRGPAARSNPRTQGYVLAVFAATRRPFTYQVKVVRLAIPRIRSLSESLALLFHE
jgi:hypothetical protein